MRNRPNTHTHKIYIYTNIRKIFPTFRENIQFKIWTVNVNKTHVSGKKKKLEIRTDFNRIIKFMSTNRLKSGFLLFCNLNLYHNLLTKKPVLYTKTEIGRHLN